jgi:hypothetical protein
LVKARLRLVHQLLLRLLLHLLQPLSLLLRRLCLPRLAPLPSLR